MIDCPIPLLGFAAYSGTGKTTLLENLIPILSQRGISTAMIKHSHHDFEIDKEGKDSFRLRKAGAKQMLIASAYRSALITEKEGQVEPELSDLIQQIDCKNIDILLVEGFRHVAFPKIELHRSSMGKDLLFPHDESIIAFASDDANQVIPHQSMPPLLSLNDINGIADFIQNRFLA